ncbi:unnamed protein product, partial [Prorocentrum cordatum]
FSRGAPPLGWAASALGWAASAPGRRRAAWEGVGAECKMIKARRRRRTKKKMPRARWREDGRPGASWPAASTPPWHGRPARIGAGQRPLPRAAWGRLGAEDEGEDQIGRG